MPAGTVKDVTIKFIADTKDLEKSSILFDKINQEVASQNKLLDTNADKHKETGKAASKAINEANESFKNFGDTLKNIGGALGIAFGVSEIINFGKESVRAFRETELASAKLQFAVEKIGGEGEAAFKRLIEQAEKLGKTTIFSDKNIKGSQLLLSQFGLQSDQIEKLLPQIIDLASATGQDLSSATQLAIQGINGLPRALKPYGIVLKDTGDKTENLANLQNQLSKFTGSAGVAMETASGKAANYANQIEILQESIGKKLSPALQSLESGALEGLNSQLTIFSTGFTVLIDKFYAITGQTDKLIKNKIEEFVSFSEEAQVRITFDLAKKGAERTDIEQQEYLAYKKILDDKLNAQDDHNEKSLGYTQKGLDEKAAAEKKDQDDQEKFNKKLTEDHIKDVEDAQKKERDEVDAFLKEQTEKKKEATKEQTKAIEDEQQAQEDFIIKSAQYIAKKQDEAKKRKAKITEEEFNFISESAKALFEYQNNLDESQLQNLQLRLDKGKISQQQYDKQVAAIKAKQAQREKDQALFNIAISTAEAVIKAIAESPATFGLPFSAFALATGAIQAAVVAARPIPKFAKGVIDLQGGIEGKDSIHAMLMPHESVMTADETHQHRDALMAIRNDRFEKYLEEQAEPFINLRLREAGLANNMARNMKYQPNFPDEFALNRLMQRNKDVKVSNADYLADRIADGMANKLNAPRRTWS